MKSLLGCLSLPHIQTVVSALLRDGKILLHSRNVMSPAPHSPQEIPAHALLHRAVGASLPRALHAHLHPAAARAADGLHRGSGRHAHSPAGTHALSDRHLLQHLRAARHRPRQRPHRSPRLRQGGPPTPSYPQLTVPAGNAPMPISLPLLDSLALSAPLDCSPFTSHHP